MGLMSWERKKERPNLGLLGRNKRKSFESDGKQRLVKTNKGFSCGIIRYYNWHERSDRERVGAVETRVIIHSFAVPLV